MSKPTQEIVWAFILSKSIAKYQNTCNNAVSETNKEEITVNFKTFKSAVAAKFERMQKGVMLRVDVDKDLLWDTYLNSFPEGTNPVYRERTEHDCTCCKQFIRAVGDAVAIVDGKLESVWDIAIPSEPGYQVVADALAALVKSKTIANTFLHYEKTAGTDKNFEDTVNGVKTWDHFFVNIKSQYVMKNADIASALGEQRALKDVLQRSLAEITIDAVDTVLELIAQNSLYRGTEHKFAVEEFRKLKKAYMKLKTSHEKELFVWGVFRTVPASVAKIRNTSIGTLLVDLSEGKELEHAVKSFETMVAPSNYKRPTALITKAMIDKAKEKLTELGLTSALERRYANIHDITINNILFADSQARNVISGDIFDDLAEAASSKVKKLDKVEEVSIEKFINDILPTAKKIEVMVENRHTPNFVSLVAPVDPTAGNLFKWDNKFSWSYNGEMTDSIKERVKAAGGSVEGDLCCRLAWDYSDDLDFHMTEPDGGHIYYGIRRQLSRCGGMLDVDANGADGIKVEPVENIFYADRRKMKEGVYTLYVNNFYRRSSGTGFEVEIEFDGNKFNFVYDKVVKQGVNITVAKIKYSKAGGFEIIESLPSSQSTKTVWNVKTQTFQKVNVMMLSPNHWDSKAVGNKHYFFMLDGCKNDTTARGFFNEFLKDELNAHRKVFEVVGSKMKVDDADEQLSGLGFSSTQKNDIICRITGNFTRMIKVVF